MKDAVLLVIGALISVWSGIVTTKWFAFQQCTQEARNRVLGLQDILFEIVDLRDAEAMAKVSGTFTFCCSNLIGHGFRGAASILFPGNGEIQKFMLTARAEILSIRVTKRIE